MERLIDRSIRIKVTNDCQLTCSFCHNEGTELPENQQKRVSVFLDEKAMKMPVVEDLTVTTENISQLALLRNLGISEVHLTGGEPTLNYQLPEIVRQLVELGFKVKMTTNGQASDKMMRQLAEAGLFSMTFSVLSFNPEEFIATQSIKSIPWAQKMIDKVQANILLAKELGLNVKINAVVMGKHDYLRIDQIRKFAEANGIKLVLLNSLDDGVEAQQAVFDYANEHGRYVGADEFVNNSKGSRHYISDAGIPIDAKYLRSFHPEVICGGCEHKGKDSCKEKFYGLRLEFRAGTPYVRLCIQKTNEQTVMRLSDFIDKDIISNLTAQRGF